jgi:adenine/guanine phosphoribosyltransferase-like PRPP-binding protein
MSTTKKVTPSIKSQYLFDVFETKKFRKLVPDVVKEVRKFRRNTPFDAIAFTGTSGSALAYALSYELNIPLICVRKDETAHYKDNVEGMMNAKTYLIVDDFIATGKTIKHIRDTLRTRMKAKAVGIMLYGACPYDNVKWKGVPVITLPNWCSCKI